MRVDKLIIKNIGKVAHTEIELRKPLILLYGEIRQGKTTILNSVRWVCGGEFPQDIIKHGEDEGSIELGFDGGMIARSFYRAKDGTTKARPVQFIRNGKPVASPVSEIRRFLNPFLLDQNFLRNKTELERKQYFAELFAVDTTALDKELFDKGREASALRSKLDGYGTIDLTPVEAVDIGELNASLGTIKQGNQSLENNYEAKCKDYNDRLNLRSAKTMQIAQMKSEIDELEKRLVELNQRHEAASKELEIIPQLPIPKEPTYVSTEEIESKLREAGATNVRAEQYQANVKRADAKKSDEDKLSTLEARQRAIRKEKQTKLKGISESCGIKGLSFDDEGNFLYEETTAGMISDSQIMKLSEELSSIYPEGFGLSLLDRGESLGKSIFLFVERAQAEKKTILATVVGEKPASVPENIGVFVVEDGKVS